MHVVLSIVQLVHEAENPPVGLGQKRVGEAVGFVGERDVGFLVVGPRLGECDVGAFEGSCVGDSVVLKVDTRGATTKAAEVIPGNPLI